MRRKVKGILALLIAATGCSHTFAATFLFNNGNPSGLNGLATGTVSNPEVAVSFAVATSGAVFRTDAGRIGVDSRGIGSTVVDPSFTKLNRLEGSAASQFEGIAFSFNQPGILNTLFFDGMKDESLENFRLELPNGSIRTIFDFEAEYRLNFQGFQLSETGVPNPILTDDAQDDITGLGIPFRAGDVFTLTYGEVDFNGSVLPGYIPKNDNGVPTGDFPDGARFEGLAVTIVPEPSTLALLAMLSTFPVRSSRKSGDFGHCRRAAN